MATLEEALKEMRRICLGRPRTSEGAHFEDCVFKVRRKIFASCGEAEGGPVIVVQLHPNHSGDLVANDPRVSKYPRLANTVSIDVSGPVRWDEIEDLVQESYDIVSS
jgi:predicted DNA-binding protein (MmcQ/YjbR family)